VKGKGLMQTYFLLDKKSGVSRRCGWLRQASIREKKRVNQ
jgi:hypothetical protein